MIKMLFIFFILYLLVCGLLYLSQEKLIFFPDKLDKNYSFNFHQQFEEVTIKSFDGCLLHGLLFKTTSPKGLVFYLHGNGGALDSWGDVARTYTDLHYDIFMLDYRGYGKSEGKITGQEQQFRDMQIVYDELKKKYNENKIIILGYSIGTGLASKLASTNHPRLLILQAPYFSLTNIMMRRTWYTIPSFILKYKLETNQYISKCKMPIVIFHGDQDEVIDYRSALKLKKLLKPNDIFITLHGQGHSNMTDNTEYQAALKKIIEG